MKPIWYLATPYSKFPGGIEEAARVAAEAAALLLRSGVVAFSPIAHSHSIAMAGGLDPLDHTVWLPADAPFMAMAHGLIMLRAPSWEASFGMNVELEAFQAAGKPVVFMDPGIVPGDLLS